MWLSVMLGETEPPSVDYPVTAFSSRAVREEYLAAVASFTDSEVRTVLIHLLGGTRSIPEWDALQVSITKARYEIGGGRRPAADDDLATRPQFSDYERRALLFVTGKSDEPTWPGLTWILDLLPSHPDRALAAVTAYLLAHAEVLPDLRLTGLSDATSIIRERYILSSNDLHADILRTIDWRDFEFLVAALYESKGYVVEVTPAQKDCGRDVVARRAGTDAEVVYIACSRGQSKKDAAEVAALNGRLDTGERAARGVFVNVAGFTERGPGTAVEVAADMPRIALVNGHELIVDLNRHLGIDWPHRVDLIITAARRDQARRDGSS